MLSRSPTLPDTITLSKIDRFRSLSVLWLACLCAPWARAQQTEAAALPEAPRPVAWGKPQQTSPAASPISESGIVSGTVADSAGALIAGASVVLSPADGGPALQTISGADGDVLFSAVAPGPFSLLVTLQGFVPASVAATLQPGGRLLEPITLQLASVNVAVDVTLSQSEIAQEQIRAEEKQRLIGFLPNFYVSYEWHAVPLTPKQKFSLAWANARDPGNLLLIGFVAGVQQGTDSFSGYGQGAQGYGKRYGAGLGNLVAGTMMGGAVLPTLFHQDPRYFYKGTGTIRARTWYAVSRSVICRGDNGRDQPNFSGVLGDLSAGAISNIYYPASDRNGPALTIENGLLGILGDSVNGIFQEFFLRHFTPSANKHSPTTP